MKIIGFFLILAMAVAAFIYAGGVLVMFVAGHGLKEAFGWPYYAFIKKHPYVGEQTNE